MRLLLVEDDPKISRFLVRGLSEERHLVDLVEDGRVAEERAFSEQYDAILLDLMVPGIDGLTVCRRLRDEGVDTPILIITARDAVTDRVRGLDAGADDYLVKPFAFDELLARLRALTRRGRTRTLSARLGCGPLIIDQDAQRASVDGTPLLLTATEYRLLEFLVRRAGCIVSRDQIAQHVWGGDAADQSNVVDVYIGYVRRKLALSGAAVLIRTVRGMGYLLAPPDAEPDARSADTWPSPSDRD